MECVADHFLAKEAYETPISLSADQFIGVPSVIANSSAEEISGTLISVIVSPIRFLVVNISYMDNTLPVQTRIQVCWFYRPINHYLSVPHT